MNSDSRLVTEEDVLNADPELNGDIRPMIGVTVVLIIIIVIIFLIAKSFVKKLTKPKTKT